MCTNFGKLCHDFEILSHPHVKANEKSSSSCSSQSETTPHAIALHDLYSAITGRTSAPRLLARFAGSTRAVGVLAFQGLLKLHHYAPRVPESSDVFLQSGLAEVWAFGTEGSL